MCTYNGERFLRAQVDSILRQTFSNFELVIVDDCSTDSTRAILEEYQLQDSRVRVLHNSQNLGFIKNFERALAECKAPLIALSDQDDIWLPEKIETLAAEIEDNLLVYSKVDLIDEDNQPLPGKFPRVKRIDGHCALSLILYNSVTGHTCLLRRELLDIALPFPADLFSHDQWLAIAAAAPGRLKACQQTLAHYRIHANNTLVGNKKSPQSNKIRKAKRNIDKILSLSANVSQRELLEDGDQNLLNILTLHLSKNYNGFYNFRLSRFLKKHADTFLSVYQNPDRARRKMCRGLRLVSLID